MHALLLPQHSARRDAPARAEERREEGEAPSSIFDGLAHREDDHASVLSTIHSKTPINYRVPWRHYSVGDIATRKVGKGESDGVSSFENDIIPYSPLHLNIHPVPQVIFTYRRWD